jgi:GT2 family glycosyltransferase
LLAAAEALRQQPALAIVCGRLREHRPEASVFNRLCDMEWNTPAGPMNYCGGIFMTCRAAFEQVGGFDANVPAGEEPELCVRLRNHGWTLERLGRAMAWHDADMHHFRQWWKRNLRAGVGYAQGYRLHGRGPLRHWAKEHRSNWIWGLVIPLFAVGLAWPTFGLSLLWFGLYPVQAWRVARLRRRTHEDPSGHCWLYAAFTVLGKLPTMLGQAKYWLSHVCGVRSPLIEHTRPASASADRTP